MVKILEEPEPTCFKEAVGKKNWEAAMDEEVGSLGCKTHLGIDALAS